MKRLHAYSARLRYLRDPVVVIVIPLLVGIESLYFLWLRETYWFSSAFPPLMFSLDRWWFDAESGGWGVQPFLLAFHPLLVALLWLLWRFQTERDRLTTICYIGSSILLAACQAWVVGFSNSVPKIVLEQIYP